MNIFEPRSENRSNAEKINKQNSNNSSLEEKRTPAWHKKLLKKIRSRPLSEFEDVTNSKLLLSKKQKDEDAIKLEEEIFNEYIEVWKVEARAKIEKILRKAALKYKLNPNLIAIEKNIIILLDPFRLKKDDSTKKSIDFNCDMTKFDNWKKWTNGIFPQIESGADELMASTQHWKTEMGGDQCKLTSFILTGSDLHGKGLGAVIAEFKKTENTGNIFHNKKKVKVVIKPEDRSIEKSLLGKNNDSFASWVNEFSNLNKNSEIKLLEMETHQVHGSIIKFVDGVQAGKLFEVYGEKNHQSRDFKNSLKEAITFAFLTGLADLNHENVIWTKEKHPYMIDSDNALNSRQLDNPTRQNGWQYYNMYETENIVNSLNSENKQSTESKILDKVYTDPELFFDKFKDSFNGKQGRAVPISTNDWSKWLTEYAVLSDNERVNFFDDKAPKVSDGKNTVTKGLKGETGESANGGNFDLAEEIRQIKIDFDKGQIPFYVYDFSTGRVLHNGQQIWNGKTVIEAIDELKNKLGL